MCRFVYYQGEPILLSQLVTEPVHSLIHQSYHSEEREEPLNGDGFGLAWYVPEDDRPALFKSVSPAWNNMNLREIARVTRSERMLAHIRAATQGFGVSETNCHPFRAGRFAFMHNGDVGGFKRTRRAWLAGLSDEAFGVIHGSTDSEHLFALFVDEVARIDHEAPDRLQRAWIRTLERVLSLVDPGGRDDHIYLNAVLTDGRNTLVCRYTTDRPEQADTLYLQLGRRYVCEDGASRMVVCEPGRTSVVVSSEPVTSDPGWEAIPVGSWLMIDAHRNIDTGALPPG